MKITVKKTAELGHKAKTIVLFNDVRASENNSTLINGSIELQKELDTDQYAQDVTSRLLNFGGEFHRRNGATITLKWEDSIWGLSTLKMILEIIVRLDQLHEAFANKYPEISEEANAEWTPDHHYTTLKKTIRN